MTELPKHAWHRLSDWLDKPIFSLLFPILAIVSTSAAFTSLTIAIRADTKAAHVASARAKDTQQQNAFLRETFCGVMVPVVLAGQQPSAQPRTALAQSLVDGATNATALLQCQFNPSPKGNS